MPEPIIIQLPLDSLTTSLGRAEQCRRVDTEDIRSLLKQGPVRFVVADIGHPIRWIAESECFNFWKRDVRTHIVFEGARLEDFSGEYCYYAAEWTDGGTPIILLEKAH
jgi:hypothetical protein